MNRIVFFGCALLFFFTAAAQPKGDYRKKGAAIPPFLIEQLNGRKIGNASLQKGKSVLMVIFSPQCDHCSLSLDTLRTMAGNLRNTQLLLVTEARNKDGLKEFLVKHGYDKEPLFRAVGWDKSNLIYFIYTYGLLPQLNIYNAQHKLVKTFTGSFPMDSLKMALRNQPIR